MSEAYQVRLSDLRKCRADAIRSLARPNLSPEDQEYYGGLKISCEAQIGAEEAEPENDVRFCVEYYKRLAKNRSSQAYSPLKGKRVFSFEKFHPVVRMYCNELLEKYGEDALFVAERDGSLDVRVFHEDFLDSRELKGFCRDGLHLGGEVLHRMFFVGRAP